MASIIKTGSEAVNRMLSEQAKRGREKEEDASLAALEQMARGQAASFDVGGSLPEIRADAVAAGEKAARDIPLYGAYGEAFYGARASAELMGKEKQRFYEKKEDTSELALIEAGLCRKFGITPPRYFPNRRGDRGESGEQLLMIGQTVNDRRNPKIWGLRSEDFTRHAHVGGPSGSGKAIKLNDLVLSCDGWKRNAELSVGDEIYTRDGKLSRIEWVSDVFVDTVFDMFLSDGRTACSHREHQWIVFDKEVQDEKVFVTEELVDLVSRYPGRYAIPTCSPIEWDGAPCVPLPDKITDMSQLPLGWEQMDIVSRERIACAMLPSEVALGDHVDSELCSHEMRAVLRSLLLSLGYSAHIEGNHVIAEKVLYVDIEKVTESSELAAMRCLGVEDPSHSYIVSDYIVTHNSTLLNSMCVEQCWYWRGGLLMEPHGDLALSVLRTAPPYRIHDILYLNVLDPLASPGFNPLELPLDASDEQRQEAVGAVTSLISKHFNMESGMVKLQKMLTNALNALSYVPGATLLEIMDVYSNEDIRNTVLSFVPDGPQKEAMQQLFETAKMDDLGSLDNRISRFTTNRYMKHLFGQSKTTVDFFDLMNRGYFIICPVSKGGTNDDTFLKFYGSYIVSQVYKSALLRDSIDEPERVNFAMVLDEFQNFISDDIEGILAEARKYGLQLCLANQILAQLQPQSMRAAVLQNCATKLYYAQQIEDAPVIAKTLGHGLKAEDLMSIPKYHVMAAPLIKGAYVRPFISSVFPPITPHAELSPLVAELIAENTRDKYMKPREEIEKEITDRKERLASGNKQAVVELATKGNI